MENLSITKELERKKQGALAVLKELGIDNLIKPKEIEDRLKQTDKIYKDYLGLGVLMRCAMEKRGDLLEKWLVGLSAWKNLTPHDDLGGLSPIEYEKAHPRGPEEKRIIMELMKSYQEKLNRNDIQKQENFDINENFRQFQEEFLSLIPGRQPFNSEHLLSNREIIIEERKLNNLPKEQLDKIGLVVGSDAIPELLGEQAARINDNYYHYIWDLEQIKKHPKKRNLQKVKEIYSRLLEIEPFMKSMPEPWRFYNNKGNVAFLLDLENEAVASFNFSLSLNSEQEHIRALIKEITKK